jgi:hypothetical protein
MLGLTLFLLCTGLAAWRAASLLASRQPEPLTTCERAVWVCVLALALWLAQGWLLAISGRFDARSLLATSVLVLSLAAASIWKVGLRMARGAVLGALRSPVSLSLLVSLAPVALWLIYSLAALWVLPVSNHDALSYHFTKSAWLTITGTFALYPSQDLRVTYFPGNYEMLAATCLVFQRSDTSTGFITWASLVLYLVTSFSLIRRVWGSTSIAALTLSMLLASPVVLLHSTAHKNDILMAALTLNALVWLSRAATRGGYGSAAVGIVSACLGLGTKFHGLFLVPVSAYLLWRSWRNGVWHPARRTLLHGALLVAAFALLGGAQYAANMISTGQVMGIEQVPTPNAVNTVAYPAVWQVPRFVMMFLAAPLLTSGLYFRVPWSGELWFWPAYELYFSHYGLHVSLLIVSLPFIVRSTMRRLQPGIRSEAATLSTAAAMLVVFNVLMGIRPYGAFAFIPRFLIFALPILFLWTWCPLVRELELRRLSRVSLAAALAIPVAYMGATVQKDGFTPYRYIEWLWFRAEGSRVTYHSNWRAGLVLDRVAPPGAVVAVDVGYDGWTYPIFGASLSRQVRLIPDAIGPYVPEPDIEWVVVDRAFPIIWGHAEFQSMNQAARYLDHGALTEKDGRVFQSLIRNADFELAYYHPRMFQAVFRRVRSAPAEDAASRFP